MTVAAVSRNSGQFAILSASETKFVSNGVFLKCANYEKTHTYSIFVAQWLRHCI